MNQLSWLIYLADVTANVDWLFDLLQFILVIGVCLTTLITLVGGGDFDADGWKIWRRIVFWLSLTLPLTIILGSIVPNKETVYAIAASELGETALNTKTGGKAVEALNSWLDAQIDPPEPKKESE